MKVIDALENREGNYMLPFFWQHGETEEVLREYMRAIHDANIKEVCLEARPHPDYAGDQWFHDVDIILDEAKKLDMKLWILDDAHFPSGQAAGHMDKYPDRLCKTYLNYNTVDIAGPKKQVTVDIEPMAHYYENPFKGGGSPFVQPDKRVYTDPEKLIRVVAGKLDGALNDPSHLSELIDLTDCVKDGKLLWDVPNGLYRIFVIYETHKGGGRDGYINFLSKESCRIQIDECYEPHYTHYKDEFGKTILGFFSDEPEIGNVAAYDPNSGKLGNPDMPLPWSEEMPALMEARFGKDYETDLVTLWFTVGSETFTTDLRTGYMDIVTRQCQHNFGEQMGNWCREHGVKYIGHIVEDCDASPGLAASQGHFFRALWGQDWAGVDNIGGQITEGGSNRSHNGFMGIIPGGEFYHHELGKLGTSLADIDPKKHGNTMCETFGAYGWNEGTRLMLYEMNHLMASGINHYVPHAFSGKDFPDFDCPPHFYAHGKNPLYKPFGDLMRYSNRICHLITDGFHEVRVAVLYHAEAEWAGRPYLDTSRVARFLDAEQIDFDIIPADVFSDPEDFDSFYDEEGLHVNGHVFTALIIPGLDYVTKETAEFIANAKKTDFLVLFAERVAKGFEGEFAVTALPDLGRKLSLAGLTDAVLSSKNEDILIYHYAQEEEDYYLIHNDHVGDTYEGTVTIPGFMETGAKIYRYDAFSNKLFAADAKAGKDGIAVALTVEPYEMKVLVVPKTGDAAERLAAAATDEHIAKGEGKEIGGEWKVSFSLNEAYPAFAEEITLTELKNINLLKESWSGVIRYENTVTVADPAGVCEIAAEDAFESLELWVNGQPAGTRIAPPYRFDVSGLLKAGANDIRFECRTTLERQVYGMTHGMGPFGPEFGAVAPSGIVGKVTIR